MRRSIFEGIIFIYNRCENVWMQRIVGYKTNICSKWPIFVVQSFLFNHKIPLPCVFMLQSNSKAKSLLYRDLKESVNVSHAIKILGKLFYEIQSGLENISIIFAHFRLLFTEYVSCCGFFFSSRFSFYFLSFATFVPFERVRKIVK